MGAGRCFQQYNFPRPQFCAVIVCMVQLYLGSFLCTCFSWMAGLSWNVSLPVTKAPSVIGGEGWYIVEAAAFWEVAFHWLPCGVTEDKIFNCCTSGLWKFLLYLWGFGVFFWYSLSFLPLNFFFFFFFPLKNTKTFLFGHCTKGCCKAGSLSDPWVLPFWSHARLSRWG